MVVQEYQHNEEQPRTPDFLNAADFAVVEEEGNMRNNKFSLKPALLILLAVMLVSYACTSVEDSTRTGTLLVVNSVTGFAGGEQGEESTPLLSDTCDNSDGEPQDPDLCTVFNDNAEIDFAVQFLQNPPAPGGSFINDMVVNRYRVDYIRPNGRNTPGVDVPFGIDGTMNIRVPVNGTANASIVVVRHEAKREPPLSNLDIEPGEGVLTANAQMKFFGQDLAGRTASAIGFLEIHFANYGEGE
jgi:hypothetical protein